MIRAQCAALAVLLAACGGRVGDPGKVAGTYRLTQEGAADTLVLRPDGRYVRTRAVAGRHVLRDSGAWEMAERGYGPWLVLHEFPSTPTVFPVADHFHWSTVVGRTLTGATRIMVSPDRGLWYERVD